MFAKNEYDEKEIVLDLEVFPPAETDPLDHVLRIVIMFLLLLFLDPKITLLINL